jgi:hypothetical protein
MMVDQCAFLLGLVIDFSSASSDAVEEVEERCERTEGAWMRLERSCEYRLDVARRDWKDGESGEGATGWDSEVRLWVFE